MFSPLHNSTNQELFKKHLCNQLKVATMKNVDNFHYIKILFTINKDEWDTKEDAGKSMKNALYILRLPKGTSQAEAMLNSGKSSP